MKKKSDSPNITLKFALVPVAVVASLALSMIPPATAASIRPRTDATTTTTSTSTTTTTTEPVTSDGLIDAGPTRSECLEPKLVGSGLAAIHSAVTKFDGITGTSVTCISAYLNGAPSWTAWEHPWIALPQYGYTSWVAQAPQTRELILQVDLIPSSLENATNPINWETSCALGKYRARAKVLGASLVAAGLQDSVIRLGAEMNGNWEADFVGTTFTESRLWTRCFDSEVSGLRGASGEHFLIDWNPNACIPFAKFYPGNAFVDIVGLDFFDASCFAPDTKYSFAQLEHERAGLLSFVAFAHSHHKPMSFPEWGLAKSPSGDDPLYIDGIGAAFDNDDFAFESYFDGPGRRLKTLALSSQTPLSLQAFRRWFADANRP
jgi:hypothetical protein